MPDYSRKIEPSDIRTIFELSLDLTAWEVAEKFEVNQSTITNILLRKSWKHIKISQDLMDRVEQAKRYRETMGKWWRKRSSGS